MEQNEAARPAHLEQDVRSLFLVDVDVPSTGTRDEMILGAVASLSFEELGSKRLDEIVRGLSSMSGPAPIRSMYPSSIRNTIAPRVPGTWEGIAGVVVSDVLSWQSVGRGKVTDFIAFVTSRVNQPAVLAPHSGGISDDHAMFDAIRSVAAWGVVAGHTDLVTALVEATHGASDSPSAAVAAIRSYDLEELAGGRIIWWDHEAAAKELLSQFGDRDLQILRSRILIGTRRPPRTLEELGEMFGCTRQRVQQLESRALARLKAYLSNDRYRSLNRAADDIRTEIGAASPIEAADAAVADDPESLVDELLLWVAGPYHRSDGWVLQRDFGDIAELVYAAFDD
ncbi:MAG: sigma factor-like helix-turn-helix DNA-binding protein, partial [Actinomycetota bacterium]|nr:sigma factor-like helix-turn-helix DNA-binding protein [Actinomycetota bacterium]